MLLLIMPVPVPMKARQMNQRRRPVRGIFTRARQVEDFINTTAPLISVLPSVTRPRCLMSRNKMTVHVRQKDKETNK